MPLQRIERALGVELSSTIQFAGPIASSPPSVCCRISRSERLFLASEGATPVTPLAAIQYPRNVNPRLRRPIPFSGSECCRSRKRPDPPTLVVVIHQALGLLLSMTVEAIKDAIAGLPEDDRHSLAAWLNDLDYDGWDRQMVKDFSPGGRGMAWAERVKREIAEGQARPMEEGFAERGSPRT